MANENIFYTTFTLLYILLVIFIYYFLLPLYIHFIIYYNIRIKCLAAIYQIVQREQVINFTVLQIFIFVLIERQIVNHKTCFAIRIDIVRFSQCPNLSFNFIHRPLIKRQKFSFIFKTATIQCLMQLHERYR